MAQSAPFAVTLDRSAAPSLPAQLATQARALIAAGSLAPGQRLPSTRALAAELGVARAVVERAFDQLIAEGWVIARRGAGTFVQEMGTAGDGAGRTKRVAGPVSHRHPRQGGREREPLVRFDTGTPWVDPRHQAGWRRAWREVSTTTMPPGYPDPAGMRELREQIALYVGSRRGVACTADEVMITAGTTHGLALVLERLGPGAVAIEDPGYRAAVSVASAQGARVVDVPIDEEGLDVGWLRRSGPSAVHAIYVTPAHQHPLGITMSAPRRVALLAEARRRGAVVIEDDYDSEFRYDVAPLPALAQLSRDVIYLGTAAKTLHPALRMGWLVGPAGLVEELADRRADRHDHPSWPLQRALLSMHREGHVDRLVRAARRVYAERSLLVRERLGPYLDISAGGAGMYVTLAMSAEEVAEAVSDGRAAGLELPSLADYCRSSQRHGLVLGFGGVSEDELARALDVVASVVRRTRGAGLSEREVMSQ
ncbi:MAG: PLP-dependent aminotransferase family protein [Nocardioidaceae bacterium]